MVGRLMLAVVTATLACAITPDPTVCQRPEPSAVVAKPPADAIAPISYDRKHWLKLSTHTGHDLIPSLAVSYEQFRRLGPRVHLSFGGGLDSYPWTAWYAGVFVVPYAELGVGLGRTHRHYRPRISVQARLGLGPNITTALVIHVEALRFQGRRVAVSFLNIGTCVVASVDDQARMFSCQAHVSVPGPFTLKYLELAVGLGPRIGERRGRRARLRSRTPARR